MTRLVLDTNVIVSALMQPLGPSSRMFLQAAGGSRLMCVSADIFAEYEGGHPAPGFVRWPRKPPGMAAAGRNACPTRQGSRDQGGKRRGLRRRSCATEQASRKVSTRHARVRAPRVGPLTSAAEWTTSSDRFRTASVLPRNTASAECPTLRCLRERPASATGPCPAPRDRLSLPPAESP